MGADGGKKRCRPDPFASYYPELSVWMRERCQQGLDVDGDELHDEFVLRVECEREDLASKQDGGGLDVREENRLQLLVHKAAVWGKRVTLGRCGRSCAPGWVMRRGSLGR